MAIKSFTAITLI